MPTFSPVVTQSGMSTANGNCEARFRNFVPAMFWLQTRLPAGPSLIGATRGAGVISGPPNFLHLRRNVCSQTSTTHIVTTVLSIGVHPPRRTKCITEFSRGRDGDYFGR